MVAVGTVVMEAVEVVEFVSGSLSTTLNGTTVVEYLVS